MSDIVSELRENGSDMAEDAANEIELLRTRIMTATSLLERSKIATLEADSDFSAYAAGRHLDKESAERVSWMCRQLYSDIKKWLSDHNGGSTDMKQG